VAAFTAAEAPGLTTDQITAMTTLQITGLSTAVIMAMTPEQVQAFTTADWSVFSNAQLDAVLNVTPIVLDLSGEGIHTLSAAQGVSFDIAATGHAHQTGWIGAGNALLVMDRNGDGRINDGSELFGIGTRLGNGGRAANGFQALAEQDTNHDGKITAADAHFNQIQLWVDANHDGKTDAGELHGLADFGIVALSLDATAGTQKDHGNLIGLVSSYTKGDGSSHAMADVWFTKEPQPPPKLSELLAAPSGELLGAAVPAQSSHTAPVETAHPAFHWRAPLEDECRQPPLI
jgi:hypothetical protein